MRITLLRQVMISGEPAPAGSTLDIADADAILQQVNRRAKASAAPSASGTSPGTPKKRSRCTPASGRTVFIAASNRLASATKAASCTAMSSPGTTRISTAKRQSAAVMLWAVPPSIMPTCKVVKGG